MRKFINIISKTKTWEERHAELVKKYLGKTILLGDDKEERGVIAIRLISPEKYPHINYIDETEIIVILEEYDTYPYGSFVYITEQQLKKSKIVKNKNVMWRVRE